MSVHELIKSCMPVTTAALQKPTDDTIFGTVECYYCNEIKTAKGARAISVEVESGRSGGSVSFGGRSTAGSWMSSGLMGGGKRSSSGSGIRFNSGRKYYKQVKTYICADCISANADKKESPSDDTAIVLLGIFLKLMLLGWGIVFLIKAINQI